MDKRSSISIHRVCVMKGLQANVKVTVVTQHTVKVPMGGKSESGGR